MVWERKDKANASIWTELGLDTRDGVISVRDEMVNHLENHGHEVFIRRPTTQRCSCYKDGAFNDADVNCPGCNGFGYYYLDTKVRSYRRPAFGTFGFSGGTVRANIGDLTSADTVWYFKSIDSITVGNVIVEVVTDDLGQALKPYKMERKHAVRLSHLYREKKGRKEYWVALARELRLGK